MNKVDFQLEQGERQMAIAGGVAPFFSTVDSMVRIEIGLRLLKRASEWLKRYQHRNAETLYCAIDEYLSDIGKYIQEHDANDMLTVSGGRETTP